MIAGCVVSTKLCRSCHIEKDVDEFYFDRTKKDALRSSCKPCVNASNRAEKRRSGYKWREKDKRKSQARNKVHGLIRRGKLVRPKNCQVCLMAPEKGIDGRSGL